VPLVGSLAKTAAVAQLASLLGRAVGQPDCVQSRFVQSQVFASEHVHELHASVTKSPGVHDNSPTAPAMPIEPAAPEVAIPVEPAIPRGKCRSIRDEEIYTPRHLDQPLPFWGPLAARGARVSRGPRGSPVS